MIHTNLILFDDYNWKSLLPLTFTRPASEVRVGITTITEKWRRYADTVSFKTEEYLSHKYPTIKTDDNIYVHSGLIPDTEIIEAISQLQHNQSLLRGGKILAQRAKEFSSETDSKIEYEGEITLIENPWDIFAENDVVLHADFDVITKGRKSAKISTTNNIIGEENIFLEEGAKVEFATLNAGDSPIYIGEDAEVMEGALIRGPFALCEHSSVKMGAKIYGATTIGPWCKVAGEIQNSVIFGYSNKGHDGYLGNAVLGEWCNIGADSNNSNLKNNYDQVRLWNYASENFAKTGLQFCGLVMGDHSKCGINTMFNTGTVVGVSANIFGSGFPRNFIPSYSWGGAAGFTNYNFNKAMQTASIVLKRRKLDLEQADLDILQHVYDATAKYRK